MVDRYANIDIHRHIMIVKWILIVPKIIKFYCIVLQYMYFKIHDYDYLVFFFKCELLKYKCNIRLQYFKNLWWWDHELLKWLVLLFKKQTKHFKNFEENVMKWSLTKCLFPFYLQLVKR